MTAAAAVWFVLGVAAGVGMVSVAVFAAVFGQWFQQERNEK